MNRIHSLAIVATFVAAAGQAFADDITVESQAFKSAATRAEVRADLVNAKTQRNPWSTSYNPLAGFNSSLSREDVRAEYIASRDEVAAFTGEDSGSFALGQRDQGDTQLAGIVNDRAGAE